MMFFFLGALKQQSILRKWMIKSCEGVLSKQLSASVDWDNHPRPKKTNIPENEKTLADYVAEEESDDDQNF